MPRGIVRCVREYNCSARSGTALLPGVDCTNNMISMNVYAIILRDPAHLKSMADNRNDSEHTNFKGMERIYNLGC